MAHKNEKIINDLCIKLTEVQRENRELKEKISKLQKEISQINREQEIFSKMKNDKNFLNALGI